MKNYNRFKGGCILSFIEKRIEGAMKSIEKTEKKIERIKQALSTGKNPYYYDKDDLKYANRDLEEYKTSLAKYLEKQKIEESIEKIPIVEEFLSAWKIRAIEWHKQEYIRYVEFYDGYKNRLNEFKKWKEDKKYHSYAHTKLPDYIEKEKELRLDKQSKRLQFSMYSELTQSLYGLPDEERNIKIENEMEKEKNNKRKLFLERVKDITGVITDAKGLTIGGNGEINGIVIGEKGSAKVNTISAGGWNIQCFHFRVLVDKIN
jgi:hypothetical protein